MTNILTCVGARPQFIKAAPVGTALAAREGVRHTLLHTGQHYDANMSDVFFEELGIAAPDHHLGIGGGPHGAMTGRQLEAVEAVLEQDRPDVLLVYGDTNSTLAGALAAAKMGIPVAHVEAGLRSHNRAMPEEINRVLTDHVSTWCFAPTQDAVRHLAAEGIKEASVHLVGDVMYDAALTFGPRARATSSILADLGLEGRDFVLATLHRQENTDDPERLSAAFAFLRDLASEGPVILPLHPRTRARLEAMGGVERFCKGLTLIEPLGYFDITALLSAARLLVSDSGGMQKEAYFHGRPVAILRTETEWVELIEMGWACLLPPASLAEMRRGLAALEGGERDHVSAPFGSGNAADHIAEIILGRAA